jgi:hypothetical protein
MKRFLKEILGYAFLALVIFTLLSILLYQVPAHEDAYLNNEICTVSQKIEALQTKSDYNTLFFGSSKTFRDIDPNIINTIAGTNAYNAGVQGLFFPRLKNFITEALQQKGNKTQKIIIEITPFAQIGENTTSVAFMNAIEPSTANLVGNYVSTEKLGAVEKAKYAYGYTMLYLHKYIGFKSILRIREHLGIHSVAEKPDCMGIDYNDVKGFISLNAQKDVPGNFFNNLQSRRNQLLDYTEKKELKTKFTYDASKFSISIETSMQSELDAVLESISPLANEIIFMIPPRQNLSYLESLLKQKNYLESKGYCVLDYSNPTQYPTLYTKEGSFDLFHLNENGTKVFSKILAQSLMNDCGMNQNDQE